MTALPDRKTVFGQFVSNYSRFRPHYPDALFEWPEEITPDTELAADIATGTGQAASALSRVFDRVVATDVSAEQIRSAISAPNVEHSVAEAGYIPVGYHVLDAITVAQALQWFAGSAFWSGARRTLRPDGVLCCFGYS